MKPIQTESRKMEYQMNEINVEIWWRELFHTTSLFLALSGKVHRGLRPYFLLPTLEKAEIYFVYLISHLSWLSL